MFGQSEPLEKRSKKAFGEGGQEGKQEGKEKGGRKRGNKGGRGKKEGGRKRKPFHIHMLGDMKSLSALKHPAAWQFTHTLFLY